MEAFSERMAHAMNSYAARVTAPDVQLAVPGTITSPRLANKCVVCHRRLRSERWASLGIGPVCARKNPEVLAEFERQRRAEAGRDLVGTVTVDSGESDENATTDVSGLP